jgi:hypothetical protein
MKKFVASVVGAAALLATPALSADLRMATKAPLVAPVVVSPWDIAFGSALMSDYNFRGITQSNHQPSVAAYFEPRYNLSSNFQLYAGVAGESISFPNRAAAEIDIYGGIRPTFGPLALDFGIWYYWYPGGQFFNGAAPQNCTNLPTLAAFNLGQCNVMVSNMSFIEYYGKGVWTVNDAIAVGANLFYDPSWLNSGAPGTYGSGTLKITAPSSMLASGWGAYVSGELGHYWFGTTTAPVYNLAPGVGTPYPGYTTWNVGVGLTYKVFTLDLRYVSTDLSAANCNVLTGDQTATFAAANGSAINPSGLGSNWCGGTFIAKLSADVTLSALK